MKRVLLCIFLIVAAYNNLFAFLTQGHFRWRNNDGTEKTATWKAPQDTAITIANYKPIRLRMEIYNNDTTILTMNRGLQYATSANGPWLTITNNSAINAFNLGGDNEYIANNDSTTKQIVDSAYTFLPGNMVTSQDPVFTDSIPVNKRREYEWIINPTPLIQPNTTYYFKSTVGNDQSLLPSLTTTGAAFKAGPAAILPNGGFENNLSGWATTTINGSSAAFDITTAPLHVHTGAKALTVTVANDGTAGNSVMLSSGPLALSDTGTYMLRFWALAKQRNALLDINLKGATTSNTCHYQIYNRFDTTKNGWQMYQYAFKVSESPVTLQVAFNTATTYYLDDVEIINSTTNPNYDFRTQYDWQNNFSETYGWLSGDNDNPVLLPDNRVAWVFNDSFMGTTTPHSNVLETGFPGIINNLMVIQKGDTLTSRYGGNAPHAQSLFSPNDGNEFWQSGGIVENNVLKVLLIEISNSNYTGHSWVGTLSLPDLAVTGLVKLPATITTSPNCVFQDGNYDYIYFGASSSEYETHTEVGRVPAGQLDSQTPWQFYVGDTTWSTDFSRAKNLIEGVTAGDVVKIGPNNYAMSGIPDLASEIDVWFAPSPTGPWGNQTTVYNIPLQEESLAYEGHLDPLGNNGVYTFSYSLYPFVTEANGSSGSVAMQIADKTTYTPCYSKANLLALSPFTPRPTSIDTLLTFTAKDVNQTVQLNWVTAQTTDDHFDVQRSPDGVNWTIIATVAGSDSAKLANYQDVDSNPIYGLNYYRIALYDIDSKLTYSVVRTVDITQSATLVSFTAKGENKRVELDWATSAELNNPGFVVQRSTDTANTSGWSTVATVAGNGTIATTSTYQAFDNSPADGLNFYRLQYYYNGKVTYSMIRVVDMSQKIALVVYPNPTSAAIQFVLKGYYGNSFNIVLSDITGKICDKETFAVVYGAYYGLQVRPAAGVYILKVTGQGLDIKTKVIVQ